MKNYFNNLCEDIKCVSKYLIILIALLTYIINCFIFTAIGIIIFIIGFIIAYNEIFYDIINNIKQLS